MAEHTGAYGFWHQDGLLVCVRKARGPYTGQLDLPGGGLELGEDPEQALARELREECGVRLLSRGPWSAFSLHVTTSSTGEPADLHHQGLVAPVVVEGRVVDVRDVEDVAAVELLDVAALDVAALDVGELSPVLRHALAQDARGWSA